MPVAVRTELPPAPKPPRSVLLWEIRLAVFLSLIGGAVDVIGFLRLGKFFAAHITGNIVMISAAHLYQANVAQILAVPLFILAVAGTWLLAKRSGKRGRDLAKFLLGAQVLVLLALLAFCVVVQPAASGNNLVTGIAAMLAVTAMGCQHAMARLCMPKAPSTAVMTGNLTNTILSLFDSLSRSGPLTGGAEERLNNSLLVLLGFVAGCVGGAVAVGWLDAWSWALPASLAATAFVLLPRGNERPAA